MTCARLAEFIGWISGVLGLLGSLALLFPVLYLLSSREAREDLNDDVSGPAQSERTERLFAKARKILWDRIRRGRTPARTLVWIGGVFLVFALVLAGLQGYCLHRSSIQ